ncbi:lysM and putative peptidoglycan-binding domain-containing protein 2-like [Panonychus citri]|uniref:lysM and putative peptidoglycan-binding domain-containing protein 2-like n=1 Tax=Panonychus citri TaxID=50023 RepID=UPI0023077494|nr:lysM and putative peptidoglycan-binding domain-containing protein 2-like [Panonychus citri]
MMSQSNLDADEYHFIGNIVRKQTKYGSTVNSTYKEPRYIEHKLQPNDTLQGLALKYNVSMERIKRANKLWTGDSLFSRSKLNIPVTSDHGTSSSSPSSLSSPTSQFVSTRTSIESNGINGTTERCDDVFLEDKMAETSV